MKHAVLALVFAGIGANALPARAAPEPASASDRAAKNASERFQRGVALYREGSFDAALAEFERAYDMSPNYRVLYNIGQVQVQREDYVEAVVAFRRYLDEGAAELTSQRHSEVDEEISRLQGRIATLRVECNVDGAELVIDGASVGTLPMAGISVNAGVRRVVVRKNGFLPHESRVTLAGGERTELKITLEAQTSEVLQPTEEPPTETDTPVETSDPVAEPQQASVGTGFWISLAATGGAAVATAVFAWRTQIADADYSDELATYPGSESSISNAHDRLGRNALATDICAGLTAVGLGTTLYFAFSGGGAPSESPQTAGPTLRTGPRGMGWEVSGRF